MAGLALPRTTVRTSSGKPAQSAPLDSTRLLVAMEAPRGLLGPLRIRNPRDIARIFVNYIGQAIPAWDVADVALREAVPEVIFTRVVGPAAVAAKIQLLGPGGQPAIILTMNEVGEFANGAAGGYKAQVISPGGGATRQIVLFLGGTDAAHEVTRSPVFSVRADSIVWNDQQTLFTATLGAENAQPVIAAAADFAGGTADSGSITTTHVDAALRRVSRDLGPTQVITPWRDSDANNTMLLDYASDFDRTAFLMYADALSSGSLVSSCGVLRGLGSGAEGVPRLGGAWAQYATGPGIVSGATRSVPWSVIMAGLTARAQQNAGHPNVAPFEDQGVPLWATGVTRYFDEATAELLYGAGCNIVKEYQGTPRNATFHTLEDPDASDWVDLAHTRTERQVRAEGYDVGRQMGSRVINRSTINDFGAKFGLRLTAMAKAGALFYDTDPSEAFRVDTDSVNDTETIRAKEVNADVGLVMAEHAEYVNVNLTKIPIGQEV